MATDLTTGGAYGFPDPLADKKTKDSKEYILQYGKAMYYNFNTHGLRILSNSKAKYRNLANYYLGLQTLDKYKKLMNGTNEDEPGKRSYLNIDWQVLNVANKFVNIMVDKIVSTGYDVELESIDPLAIDMKKDMEYTMKTVMELKEWIAEMGIKLNPEQLGFDPELLPDHSDELQIHIDMNIKERFAMEGEMAISLHMNNNDFEQVRKEYIRDGVIYGIHCVETRNDRNGNTKIKRFSPETVIVSNSKSEDFKDVTYGGYIERMSFQELQTSAGSEFTEEEYIDIFKNCGTTVGNITNDMQFPFVPNISQNVGEKMISVMKGYYKVDIQNTYVKKKDSRNNDRLYSTGNNTKEKEGQKLIKDSYEVVYEFRWIIGSNYIYEYGMLQDMEVSPNNPCATRIPLHVIYPNMINGLSNSILHYCLPILDQINIAWYQFQHMMSKIIPDGPAINQDALADIALGKGGKKSSPLEILDLYNQTGALIYSSKGLDGLQNGNALPIIPMKNGNHEKALSHLNNVFTMINILRQITGLNEGVDASTPSTKALVGTTELAISGANSALGFLFGSDKLMVKHIAESLLLLTQSAVRYGNVSGYVDSIGIGSVKFWEINKDITLRQFGMKVVTRPSAQEWTELYQHLQGMLDKGILNYSEYSVIREMTNLKQARKYMAVVERRKKKEEAAQQQSMMEQQGQLNQQSVMTAEQAKQQTLQLEIQLKSALLDKERDTQIAVLDRKYGYDIQLKQMEMQQKSEASDTAARTNVVETSLNNQTALQQTMIQSEQKKKETAAA